MHELILIFIIQIYEAHNNLESYTAAFGITPIHTENQTLHLWMGPNTVSTLCYNKLFQNSLLPFTIYETTQKLSR
jgi:hypothetical protein